MRDAFPFLGIAAPARRALSRTVLAGTPRPDDADRAAVALRCWASRARFRDPRGRPHVGAGTVTALAD